MDGAFYFPKIIAAYVEIYGSGTEGRVIYLRMLVVNYCMVVLPQLTLMSKQLNS
jgi:hypothetical protein